jgi:hypothetical protein
VFNLPDARLRDFAIRCKVCAETIPASVGTVPDTWIVAECLLCGERGAYLAADIFRGRLSHRLTHKLESTAAWGKHVRS